MTTRSAREGEAPLRHEIGLDPAQKPLHSQLIKRNIGSLSEI
jgi:hypothetical protein